MKQVDRIERKNRIDASQRHKRKGKRRRHRAVRRVGKLLARETQ